MPGILKRRSTPPILAVSAVALLVVAFVLLSGGGSQGAAATGLAGYAPPDSVAYAEADLRPDGRVASEVDEFVQALTGMSLEEAVTGALGRSEAGAAAGIGSWPAGPVAIAAGDGREEVGLIAEVADTGAADDFAGEVRAGEGFPEGARVEVVGDALVFSRSPAWFDRISGAFEGESLADSSLYREAMEDAPGDSIASLFVSDSAVLSAAASADPRLSGLLEAMGIEPRGTATVVTLSLEGGVASLEVSGGPAAGRAFAGADGLIAGFPADSVLAAGSGDVGESLAALIAAADGSRGAGDDADPAPGGGSGRPGALLEQASVFGIDLQELASSLESAGVFVTGSSGGVPEGALVATTSDPELVRDSIESVAALGGFAGAGLFRPLPTGLEGFSVAIPGMEGRRVAVAADGDRLTVALGVEAARQALDPGPRTLGDTDLYRRSTSGLSGDGVSLFAIPAALPAPLSRSAGYRHGGEAARKAAVELISSVETVVAGPGRDGGLEIEIDLAD